MVLLEMGRQARRDGALVLETRLVERYGRGIPAVRTMRAQVQLATAASCRADRYVRGGGEPVVSANTRHIVPFSCSTITACKARLTDA